MMKLNGYMSISVIVSKIIGAILAIAGLWFTVNNLGLNWNLLIGLIVTIIGCWILLGRNVSI